MNKKAESSHSDDLTSAHGFRFLVPRKKGNLIKVIGVGGAGSNAVNYIFNKGLDNIDYLVCNTDSQALQKSPIPEHYKLLIGANLTNGLGSGANPEIGKLAALESQDDIRDAFKPENKMVFITAGMGKGTGTGAAPIIARISKEQGILTVGVVTAPFSFEGRRKIEQAYFGIEQLREYCDTLIIIPNDKLLKIYPDLGIREAFLEGDQILVNSILSIIGIISTTGYMNVDFADIATVMRNAGSALISFAEVNGTERALQGATALLNSPLLGGHIYGAKHIILSITCSSHREVVMHELFILTEYLAEKIGMEPDNVILGHVIDDSLDDTIKLSMIATGFDMQGLDVFKNIKAGKNTAAASKPIVNQLSIDGTLDKEINPALIRYENPEDAAEETHSGTPIGENQIGLNFNENEHKQNRESRASRLDKKDSADLQKMPWSAEKKVSKFNLSDLD
jgi:cell division protein FtsZ